MRIDWEYAHERPNKKQKIEGKYLLDLRAKVVEIEQTLAEKNKEIEQEKEKFKIQNSSFNQLTEKFIFSEKNLNSIISDLRAKLKAAETKAISLESHSETKFGVVSNEKVADLEQKIINKDNEIMRVKFNLEKTSKEVENLRIQFNQIIATKDQEIKKIQINLENTNKIIENLKPELLKASSSGVYEVEKYKSEIEQKNKQIEINKHDLEYTIVTKDKVINKLEKDLEAKIEKVNELNSILNEITQGSTTQELPNILTKIKKTMALKGFVTDKEFEQYIKEIE